MNRVLSGPGITSVSKKEGYRSTSIWVVCGKASYHINISSQESWRVGCSIEGPVSYSSMNRLATIGLRGNQWLLHAPVSNTYLGTGYKCCKTEIQQGDDVVCGHGCSFVEVLVLFQLPCNVGNGWVQWN